MASDATTSQWLDRLRSGDPRAFAELVHQHRRRIQSLAHRITRSQEDAEDVSQEVFIRAYKALPRFRGEAEIGTWLYRITVNAALNLCRRRKPQEVKVETERRDPAAGPVEHLAGLEIRTRMKQAMGAIPPKQRAVLALRLQQELSFPEIARIMGSRVGTAKANYFHAVRKLRTAMEDLR